MFFKLASDLFLTRQSLIRLVASHRCFSRNVILLSKAGQNGELTKQETQTKVGPTITRTIDAKLVLPSKSTQRLESLRRLSAKNFILANILSKPINIIVWSQLPKQEKIDSSVRSLGDVLFFMAFLIAANVVLLIYFHYQHEITKRYFFNTRNQKVIDKLDEKILNEIMTKYEGKFVSSSNPLTQNLDRVLRNLIGANKEFVEDERFDKSWSSIVIDDDKFYLEVNDEMKFVILTKPVAQMCQNEHQLAYLLANALAHFILKHKREPLSNIKPYNLWTGFKLLHLTSFWHISSSSNLFKNFGPFEIIDKGDHLMSNFFYRGLRKIEDTMCYSDTLEEEADRIALQLLARACFDVREAERIATTFANLATPSDAKISKEEIEKHRYIYKHSFNNHKLSFIHKNLPKFVEFRDKCGCTPLNFKLK